MGRSVSGAVHQLRFARVLPFQITIEGIAADTSVTERTVSAADRDFFDETIDIARSNGGWLGVDPSAPLQSSDWIVLDDAWDVLPDETVRISELFSASPLASYDQWIQALGESNIRPPLEVTDLLVAVDSLASEIDQVLERLDADLPDLASATEEARSERRILFVLAGLFVAVALGLAASGTTHFRRRARVAKERAERATRDALTGIGNRYELEERTSLLMQDSAFAQHCVAIIDLDGFKLVNDVHGHAAGDAVLVAVATRLTETAHEFELRHEDATTSVVRLGGDEFLFSVHGGAGWDEASVRAGVDVIRGDSIRFEGSEIPLGFSVGTVFCEGQHDLSDVMRAADLAVYDDKSARARVRQAVARLEADQPDPSAQPS